MLSAGGLVNRSHPAMTGNGNCLSVKIVHRAKYLVPKPRMEVRELGKEREIVGTRV